ncbi:5735_t:CDS:2 [Entrophospora sp. SA101]|nr:601_t:CDS:2 [Entrophospora sp. SA101]CAJ0838484.1 5735_t:CDS:2 [Entrophospora sp. SA101]CAJ0848646.1 4865_t:CDS:2 [Entrophospora sp. SA101]
MSSKLSTRSRRRKHAISQLNLMVVGFRSLGKTSFIRMLYDTLYIRKNSKEEVELPASLFQRAETVQDAEEARTKELYSFTLDIEEEGEKISLTLVDSPGFVRDNELRLDVQVTEALRYIEAQFDQTLAEVTNHNFDRLMIISDYSSNHFGIYSLSQGIIYQETKVKRNPKAQDSQIHACIYFIDNANNGLTDKDIRILKRLTARVNVIPVVAKADLLTTTQLRNLKKAINRDLKTHQIPVFDFPVDEEELEPDIAEVIVNAQSQIPFSLIAPEDADIIDPSTGEKIRGRQYAWGIIDCLNPSHCDFVLLRNVLLSSHRKLFKDITLEVFYEQYRTERLMARKAKFLPGATTAYDPGMIESSTTTPIYSPKRKHSKRRSTNSNSYKLFDSITTNEINNGNNSNTITLINNHNNNINITKMSSSILANGATNNLNNNSSSTRVEAECVIPAYPSKQAPTRKRSFSIQDSSSISSLSSPLTIRASINNDFNNLLSSNNNNVRYAITNNIGKQILNQFNYPLTLTWIQFGFVAFYCYLFGNGLGFTKLEYPSHQILNKTLPLSLFSITGHVFSSYATSKVPVSFVHTIKALSPLFTVFFYKFGFKVNYSSKVYISLLPLTIGVMLACSSSTTSNFIGFLFALGSTVIFVAQNIFSKKILFNNNLVGLKSHKLDELNVSFYSSLLAFVLMYPMWLYYEGSTLMFNYWWLEPSLSSSSPSSSLPSNGWIIIFYFWLNGSSHFAQNILALSILSTTSPVTYSIASLVKRIFVITASIIWFGQKTSLIQGIGITLTFWGLYMYNQAKKDVERKERKVLYC